MEFNNGQNKCYKLDGNYIWNSRSIAVVGMILMRHEGELYVILGKRGKLLPNAVGQWCMPCGFLDWDETTEEAVVREVWEESGFNLYKAMNEFEILCDNMNFPWRLHSVPNSQAQNVSLHYAIVFDTKSNIYRDVAKLPELSIDNNPIDPQEEVDIDNLIELAKSLGHDESWAEERARVLDQLEKENAIRLEEMKKDGIREVDDVRWVKVTDLHKYDCAFEHDHIINVYVNSLPSYDDQEV